MKKVLILLLSIVLAFAIPYGFAKTISDFMMKDFVGSGATYYFLSALSHRFFQFIIVVGLFYIIFRKTDVKMGFNFKNLASKIKSFKWVFIIWPILTIVFFLVGVYFVDGFIDYFSNLYPMGTDWFFAKLGRDVLLLDALAEEVLYRALVICLLSLYWKRSHAFLLSVLIFSLAHVQVAFFPFSIIGYDVSQLCLTILTGMLFGYSYLKTKNLIVPVLLHGYTNMIIALVAYLTVFLT